MTSIDQVTSHDNGSGTPSREPRGSYREIRRQAGKPAARGLLHLIATPLAIAFCIVLIVMSDTGTQAVGAAVFLFASTALFGFSALYHLGNWSPKVLAIMRKIDHANIFVLIAGTYTPISLILLEGSSLVTCLSVVWGGAIIGSIMHISWIDFPRWLYVALYVAVGWIAIWYLPEIWRNGSPTVVILIIAGGVIYTIGALFYATKRPNPWPRHFGFHEFFHLCTVLAYACHAVAIALAYAGV
ncbi:PAQR family membrane homeostasis protein TrhA [Flaviflexus massiliensis]|uniref:PAQR family membrane homeostasis protein TrhA n=1 Tax=Flaviflexus massiliensis TaxID=1522309 RepID=UPI0009EB81BB|nr:hemolysin III family protein [Flaviflexus massiliensis]